ncbi:MAG: hypothetical protein AAGJ56_09785 [Myxococcota bacterium]
MALALALCSAGCIANRSQVSPIPVIPVSLVVNTKIARECRLVSPYHRASITVDYGITSRREESNTSTNATHRTTTYSNLTWGQTQNYACPESTLRDLLGESK